jgi:hypothetical protein
MIIDPIVPEDEDDMFLRNINDWTQINTTSHPKFRNMLTDPIVILLPLS